MLQRYHLDIVVTRQIDATNDVDHSRYVCCAVRNDQHVRTLVCSKVTVLAKGRRIAEGSMKTVANKPEVIDAYLGGAKKDVHVDD